MMQENFGQNEFQGVVVPPETVADSNAKKAKRVRTLAELPVSRDAVSLLGEVMLAVKNGPNSLRKYYDEMMHASFELITSIGMADLSRDPEQRVEYINCTLALVNTVRSGFAALRKVGLLQKDELSVLDCARIEQVMNSYLGFCKPHRTYRLRCKALAMFGPAFYRYFYIRNHHDSIRTKMKYRPITLPPVAIALAA